MSYTVQVTADSTGKWYGNSLHFATSQEATWYASDLSWRWTAVRDTRIVETADDVNARVVKNKLQHWKALPDGTGLWVS